MRRHFWNSRYRVSFLLLCAGLVAYRNGWPEAESAASVQAFEWNRRKVEIRPGGGVGRTFYDRDFHREVEILENNLEQGNRWKLRAFIFREIDVTAGGKDAKRRFTDEEVSELDAVVRDFARCVRAYSRGLLELDLAIHVIDAPLRKVSGDEKTGYSAWTDVTGEQIGPFVEDDADNVIVYFPSAGLPVPYWGGTTGGGTFKNAGYSCICVLDKIDHDTYTEVTLHEWLHQVDWALHEKAGYPHLPVLHDAEKLGYRSGAVRRGWMDWYWDFINTYVSEEAWRRLSMSEEDPTIPRPKFEGGYVTTWRIQGPFDNEADKGFDLAQIAEENPSVEDWRIVARQRSLDFLALFERRENVTVYAHVYARSAEARTARLWMGSDDGVKVWLNGELVHEQHVHRPLKLDQDVVDVDLARGWNRILVKVDQGGGDWELSLRISNPEGTAITPLEFSADPPGELAARARRTPRPLAATFRWNEVRADPFRLLPLLDPRDVGVTAGDHFLALGDSSETRLSFADRALARRGDIWLVRCDAMDLVAALDLRYDAGAWSAGAIEEHLAGWVSLSGRPAFVAKYDPGFDPRSDLELLGISMPPE